MLTCWLQSATRVSYAAKASRKRGGRSELLKHKSGARVVVRGSRRTYTCGTFPGSCEEIERNVKALRVAMPALPADLLKDANPFFTATHAPRTPEKLHVREYGSGPNSVVMLHGLSQTGESWKPLLEHMNSRTFRYICPDLLGHGESSCTPYLKYTPNTHLHFLQRDVVNRIGSPSGLIVGNHSQHPFRLVGVGLGAILALELASRMPSRVISLHLISLPCYETEIEASEDLLSHLIHPMGQFKFLSRVSSALISYNDDIMKPLIDISRLVAHPKHNDSNNGLPEQIHAYCSTVDEVMVKHRIQDAAERIESSRLRMDLIQGAMDSSKHTQMVERFYAKHVNSSSILYLDGASTDIPRNNPEALGLLLTEDYMSSKQ